MGQIGMGQMGMGRLGWLAQKLKYCKFTFYWQNYPYITLSSISKKGESKSKGKI